MSIYMVDPEYSVSALNSSVPPSMMPSMAQRPIAGCSSNLVSIVSQSSTQPAGGLVQINCPNQPNTYIKAGSAFIKMQVNINAVGTATNAGVIQGGNSSANFASLILRATMSAGSNILEQINQYAYYDELLNLHAGSAGYYQGNMNMLYGQSITTSAAGGANPTYNLTVCIPVSFGLLNSPEEQHFPLGLLNSGVQISLDLQGDVNQALFSSSAGYTAVNYSVSNVSFNYEAIKVPTEHFQSLRMEMSQSGSLYQLPYYSALNMSIASTATVDQTLGVGLSSLKGVFSTIKPASAFGTAYASARRGLTQHRVSLDGQLVNQYSLPQIQAGSSTSDVEFFVELNRALGTLGSTVRTVGPTNFGVTIPATSLAGAYVASTYANNYFWTGLCTNKFAEHGLTYSGSAVSQVQIHGETIAASGVTYYIVMIFDACCFINAQGDISINR